MDGDDTGIKIMATDDERIKSFGEVLTNDSSRTILQELFNERMSAAQLAQKTGMSLQLARYHLQKMLDLGVVRIDGVEKNSKSQDMKMYTAAKSSIVIVPPKLSDKTKGSKMLAMSFRYIYKVAGFGAAAGLSGLLTFSSVRTPAPGPGATVPAAPADQVMQDEPMVLDDAGPEGGDFGVQHTLEESLGVQAARIEPEAAQNAADVALALPDLFVPLAAATAALSALAGYYAWRLLRTA